MAGFFGNSMFGHNFQATAFQQNYGNSTGSFSSSKKSQDMLGSKGFGQNGMSGQMQGHEMHGAPGIHRQNSLLSEMTRSKSDKSANPWLFTHTPGHVEDGAVLSLYEKPLEKEKVKKKPPLQRQNTFGGETFEPRRAPSFASDPGRMRSRTVSTSSAPGGRLPLQRSVSIIDEPLEPINMDRARPVLRRAQTMAAEKERRKSEASIRVKKPLLPLHMPRFGRRKSSKSTPDSETTSLSSTPPRSRTNTTISSPASYPGPSRRNTDSRSSLPTKSSSASTENVVEDPEQTQLILSLMNPATEDVFEPDSLTNHVKQTEASSWAVQEPSSSELQQPQSPTVVSKRVHKLLPADQDDVSMTSGQFTPRSVQSAGSDRSSSVCPSSNSAKQTKPYPGKSFLDGHMPITVEPSDSESSETFYDCAAQEGAENGIPNRKGKKRMPKRKRETSTSTCTDGEDTTSTSDTPVRNEPEYTMSPYRFNGGSINNHRSNLPYSYEAETLPIHRRHVIADQNGPCIVPTRSQPVSVMAPVKTYIYGSAPTSFENLTITVQNPVKQKLDSKYSSDPKDLPGNDTCTADSSESGYATSHRPLSPRDCDIKVLNFVNSLPNHPDMEEEHSEVSQDDVLNGSETETDTEEPNSPVSNFSNMNCVSGSETDAESIGSNNSELEVLKLLESPTEVSARVEKILKNNESSKKPKDEDSGSCSSKRKNSNSSQTEVLQVYKKESDDQADKVSEKSNGLHEKPVEANVVVVAKESSSPLESPVVENHILKPSYKSSNSFFERPLLSFRSTNSYQNLSRCTQCIDLMLSCLNVILFLTSAAVIGLALWLLLKNFNVNQMTEILGNNLLQVIIYLSIGGAGTAMLAAFCLCCGVRQDKTGLGFYAFVLILVVFAFATAAVLSAMFADKLGSIEFKVNFRERLITKYGLADEKANEYFTESWDEMHKEFECCGVEGNENDTYSWAVFKRFSAWYRKQPFKATRYVPESCCRKNSNTEVCQGSDHNLLGPPVYGPPLDKYYPQKNSNLNTKGCYDLFAKHTTIVVAWTALVTGGLAGLYFIVAMLTWFFCFKRSREDTESYFDESYYDMEVNNDVFEMTDGSKFRQREPRGTPESRPEKEILLSSQSVSIHRIPPANNAVTSDYKGANAKSKVKTIDNSSPDLTREDDSDDNTDSEHEDTESETDSDQEYEGEQFDPVITRRNMWLSSESRAGHLLSLAIEEEDSNFEDSDND